jgi:hypothetical protein
MYLLGQFAGCIDDALRESIFAISIRYQDWTGSLAVRVGASVD